MEEERYERDRRDNKEEWMEWMGMARGRYME